MAHIVAMYDAEAGEVRVEWDITMPDYGPEGGTGSAIEDLPDQHFVDDYLAGDQPDDIIWPGGNYRATVANLAGTTYDEAHGITGTSLIGSSHSPVYVVVPVIPDIV